MLNNCCTPEIHIILYVNYILINFFNNRRRKNIGSFLETISLHWNWEIRDVSGLEKHFGICRMCRWQEEITGKGVFLRTCLFWLLFLWTFLWKHKYLKYFKIVLGHKACIHLKVMLTNWTGPSNSQINHLICISVRIEWILLSHCSWDYYITFAI